MPDIPAHKTDEQILDDLRNAVAKGSLLFFTGAGISTEVQRKGTAESLPNWRGLLYELRVNPKFELNYTPELKDYLNFLIPSDKIERENLSADVLIEAAEIISNSVDEDAFNEAVAEAFKVEDGAKDIKHEIISDLDPAGIVTFNYDMCHENAFSQKNRPYRRVIHDENAGILELLTSNNDIPFLLKAHGSTDKPKSIILTSSSYRKLMSENRAYRFLIQSLFLRHNVLFIGFGMSDRDFDHLMSTLEYEIGKTSQSHVFVTKRPDLASVEGREVQRRWTALQLRHSIDVYYIDSYEILPSTLESLRLVAGSHIRKLVDKATSPTRPDRIEAHRLMSELRRIGKMHAQIEIDNRLQDIATNDTVRSELIYSLRYTVVNDIDVLNVLLREIDRSINANQSHRIEEISECLAHALLVLGGLNITSSDHLKRVEQLLGCDEYNSCVSTMDSYLASNGRVKRISDYTRSALAEIRSRYNSN